MEADETTVPDLVRAAVAGDRQAWNDLVERYTPLVLSVAARYRLPADEAADISQTLWLRLVQHLPQLRDPARLPGWIKVTARNECFRVLAARRRVSAFDFSGDGAAPRPASTEPPSPEVDAELELHERHEALLLAFAELPDRDRQLLSMLLADPPLSYAEIGARLGMPVGGIGPNRARAIARLRRSPALAALLQADHR